MVDITILNDDPLLGADSEGNLYDGERISLGHDQLTIVTTIAEDGLSFERTTGHGGTIISKSTVTFDGFSEGSRSRATATAWSRDASSNEEDIAAVLEELWETEKQITTHGKAFIDAYVDGVLGTVEKTYTFIEWTER